MSPPVVKMGEQAVSYVYRFFNQRSGEHFYTSAPLERNNIIYQLPDFNYEGIAMTIPSGGSTQAVYRFYRRDTGTHFYTANAAERDSIISNLNDVYAYEGAAFNASSTPFGTATQAVYRFYDASRGVHFFTAYDSERDAVLANLPNYSYEGIAYYAAPPPAVPRSGALDEAWYLSAYPDVRDAVNAGLTTASAHFAAFGQREGRLPNSPDALSGDNSIISGYSAPNFGDTVNGGAGNDILQGGDGSDIIFGETGNDYLYGLQSDTLNGGSGNDTYYANSAGVIITEGLDGGDDTVYIGYSGTFNLPSNVENVRLSNTLTSPLTIVGTNTGDKIALPAERYDYDGFPVPSSLQLFGGGGNDTIVGLRDTLIHGGSGDDVIASSYWRQYRYQDLVLTSGNDTIYGDEGNDTLIAGAGTDWLSGGSGADEFLFDFATTSRYAAVTLDPSTGFSGTTVVTDFQPGEDHIRVLGTSLSAQQVLERFADYNSTTSGYPSGIRGVFGASDFPLAYGGTQLTIELHNVSMAQLSASAFTIG